MQLRAYAERIALFLNGAVVGERMLGQCWGRKRTLHQKLWLISMLA